MGELQDEGKQIDEITIFEDTGFYTVFVYIKTDNGEYLMQFAERPDFTGLENGVLYTWDEVETAIYEGFALEQFIDPNEDLSKSGGVPKILITK